MGGFRRWLFVAILVTSFIAPQARADSSMREFVMSCTYGVLAGTLVGAALLAFTDQPGENLSKVARGASLGLYTGILLGFYVVYGVSEPEDPSLLNGPSEGWRAKELPYLWAVTPTFSTQGRVDGAAMLGEVYRF
ncbi:MAG: hypothetical protein AB7N80_12210 [Bdellovibrionales bacterium]